LFYKTKNSKYISQGEIASALPPNSEDFLSMATKSLILPCVLLLTLLHLVMKAIKKQSFHFPFAIDACFVFENVGKIKENLECSYTQFGPDLFTKSLISVSFCFMVFGLFLLSHYLFPFHVV
jgi:hypothetical protein